jgi:hypothetical protein
MLDALISTTIKIFATDVDVGVDLQGHAHACSICRATSPQAFRNLESSRGGDPKSLELRHRCTGVPSYLGFSDG